MRVGSRAARNRVLLAAAVLLVGVALLATLGRPALQRWLSSRQPLPVGGQVVVPALDGLAIYSLSDGRRTLLVPNAPGRVVGGVAWSPDGSRIAYSLIHARPGDPVISMEIYVVGADGSASRPIAERDRPGAVLDMPTWSPDGREVYFSAFGQADGRSTQRIERVAVEDGRRTVVVENAYAPAISPDGQTLLFVRDERIGSGLWRMPVAGGEPSPVLAPGRWPTIGVARFSPDGSRIAVSLPESAAGRFDIPDLLAWLLPPVAYAHGPPADIWTFDLQGDDVRQLTHLSADEPMASWSSDGRHIAVWCEQGLFLVEAAGGEARQLLDEGGYGTIDWRP